jgi:DNA-binding PadR family transcriptional regulator
MGHGEVHSDGEEGRSISTMHLILVLLADSAPEALSTYEIGLAIADDKHPPRPMSVLIKSLYGDKYVSKERRIGKRAALWTITERGLQSLSRRADATREAREWLSQHPNRSRDEDCVMRSLDRNGPQAASRLADTCGLLHSPVRTALKRLSLRGMVAHVARPVSEYRLTDVGRLNLQQTNGS